MEKDDNGVYNRLSFCDFFCGLLRAKVFTCRDKAALMSKLSLLEAAPLERKRPVNGLVT